MDTRSLWHIGQDMQALAELMDRASDDSGEVTDSDVANAMNEWFATRQHEQGAKLDRYAGLISSLETDSKQLQAVADSHQQTADQFARAAKARLARVERLKDRLKQHMQETGQTKAVSDQGRVFTVCKNGGKQSVDVDPIPLTEIPPEFLKPKVEVDKDAIREALQGGRELPFARLKDRGTHVKIQVA